MTPTIVIRPYYSNDLHEVLHLLRISLGESETNRRSPELFSWKHVDNPFGRSIMLVAEDSGGIVGFRAFMRWELADVGGRSLRCVRPVDTATHPRARRQGIFRNLTLAAVEAAQADAVDLIFNTPNPRSKAGYLTMGWVEVGRIGVLIRPKIPSPSRRRTGLVTVPAATAWDDQALPVRAPRGLRTPRTTDYLSWRFRHPFARYLVVGDTEGLAVLRPNRRKGRREVVVSELMGPRGGQALRRVARQTDTDYLVAWFSPRSPERRQAFSAGLLPVPVTALHLVARPLRPDLAPSAIDPKKWDLALSDLELL